MDTSETTHAPEESGLLRRGIFPRREQAPAEPPKTETETELDDLIRRAIGERLNEGVAEMESSAAYLMREIAGEVWRTSAGDVRPEQERIMSILSKDQTV